MSRFLNSPDPVDEKLTVNRVQIENRAKWFAFIHDEMVRSGVTDTEGILRRAIDHCGEHVADQFLKMTDGKTDPDSFRTAFFHDIGLQSFLPSCTECSKDTMTVEYRYCALVESWEKLGYDDETISKFCSIAMEGDRAIARKMGYELELTETLADKCSRCKLRFHR